MFYSVLLQPYLICLITPKVVTPSENPILFILILLITGLDFLVGLHPNWTSQWRIWFFETKNVVHTLKFVFVYCLTQRCRWRVHKKTLKLEFKFLIWACPVFNPNRPILPSFFVNFYDLVRNSITQRLLNGELWKK